MAGNFREWAKAPGLLPRLSFATISPRRPIKGS